MSTPIYKIVGIGTIPPQRADHWHDYLLAIANELKAGQAAEIITNTTNSSSIRKAWRRICAAWHKEPKCRESKQANGKLKIWVWFK